MEKPGERNDRRQEEELDLEDILKQRTAYEARAQAQVEEEHEEEPIQIDFSMKPKDVKEALDKDVIGQDLAKKYLANGICYHYARIKKDLETGEQQGNTIKKNILLVGNTGVGKTYLVSKVAKLVGVPFVKADATKYTAAGYVGKDVDDMVRDLYSAADRKLQLAQYGIIYLDEVDKIAGGYTFGKDVGGSEVQRGLLKLMEETEVDIMTGSDPMAAMQAMRDMQVKGQDKKPKISTKNILFIMSGAFPGLKRIVENRIYTTRQCAVDEPLDDCRWHSQITSQDLIDFGMDPEFVGRLPIRVGLQDLNEDDLYNILKRSGDSVIRQYVNDLDSYGIKVDFTDDALRAFASRAAKEQTGARSLAGVIEAVMLDFMYELPSTGIKTLTVDKYMIEHPQEALIGLTMHESLDRFSKQYYENNGIRIVFEENAYDILRDKAREERISPDDICRKTLERYDNALKLFGQKAFTITADVIADPQGYLNNMIRTNAQG